ncbi:MAG: amino acid permease, partial [Chthoniobacteraceae bacterium]
MSNAASKTPEDSKFGTFGGVFTPSTLTILGVIMFLRFGQVVGEAGLIHAIVIVLSAKLITTLTGLSIAAIATNARVEAGGAYYLISRSLGVEFGGAIGVVFFLAQAVSVAMYVIGFTEAFLNLFPTSGLSPLATGTIVNAVVFICVFIGAGWTIKVQFGILAILVLSLIAFATGAVPDLSSENFRANLQPEYLGNHGFFTMFALFFPAVTGIMAGVNMSGDLRSPRKSIPAGTLAAIGVTAATYLIMAFLFAASRPRGALQLNRFVMLDISASPALINAGIFAATLSSALGSMMGAPRILQALARDD